MSENKAPGHPGHPPTWTASTKEGTGTALQANSRVWYTINKGILNEVYFPRIDLPCTRDMGHLVTDGKDFFSEEQSDTETSVSFMAPAVPGFRLFNRCKEGRYQIVKEIISDPRRPVVVQHTRFEPQAGSLEDYHLYVTLSPHLGAKGYGNTGCLGEYKGTELLLAQRDNDYALGLACSAGWLKRSVGYFGESDGWRDIKEHGEMTWAYENAPDGNVVLTGEIDLQACDGEFLLVLAFGRTVSEASHHAHATLDSGIDECKRIFVQPWEEWRGMALEHDLEEDQVVRVYDSSLAVLRTHESKNFAGGVTASLSIPWGFAKGDDNVHGYHLVWPRDLVETAGGLIAAGYAADAKRVLDYLHVVQEKDGHWAQNLWLDGTPYWTGIQVDETALPILLIEMLRRGEHLGDEAVTRYWTMVKRAAEYILGFGPATDLDRWEEKSGYSPYTLAVEVASLLVAANLAELQGEEELAEKCRATADDWNDQIEAWTYVTGTRLAEDVGVEGYYVRIVPRELVEGGGSAADDEEIANITSPDALALVHFGLRRPDDPRILNTIKVIDATLKTETPVGPVWHRYNYDKYGEKADGTPYDGSGDGIGRGWPLLTGERAHYELAAGRPDEARRLLHTLASFANDGALIPEQVWDTDDIPEKGLYIGKPTGSATPLVWAHAEYIKLCRSLSQNGMLDTPQPVLRRYHKDVDTFN